MVQHHRERQRRRGEGVECARASAERPRLGQVRGHTDGIGHYRHEPISDRDTEDGQVGRNQEGAIFDEGEDH